MKNKIHRMGLAAAALLTLSLPSTASLPKEPPIAQELPAAACLDNESPEARQQKGSRLLVHAKLASHLLRLRSDNHHPLEEYRCEGAGKAYHARIAGDAVTVESRYLPEGTVHASMGFQKSRRHGVLRTWWLDGAVQSVEYHCQGQPVGFHRYQDPAGRLVAIADHAYSDYRWQRRLQGMRTTIEPATEADKSDRVVQQPLSGNIHIRRLFGVQGTEVGVPALQRPAVGDYQSLNPEARLAQLVTAGDQGFVTLEGRRVRIINTPMDYTPFWEVYERERKGLPGADPLPSETRELLACPWIDEAMAPPLPHPALARPALAALTDAERQATPRARYEACLQQPTAGCLMHFALPLALNEQSSRELLLRATAVAALELGQPGVARPAIEELFAKESGFDRPNPHFAVPELLRAQAALRASDKAQVHAKAALAHAQRVAPGYSAQTTLNALKRVGPELARMGFTDLATSAYEQLKASDELGAAEILAAVGEAHAGAGRLAPAADAAAQLRSPIARPVPDSPRGKEDWSFYSPRTAQAHAFALIAQALAQKGDITRAREMLARAEAASEQMSGSFFDAGAARLALALAHARAGNLTPAQRMAEPPGNERWTNTAWDGIQRRALASLCDAGRVAYWMDKRAYPHIQVPKPSEWFTFARFGALASAHLRCGQVQAARALLEQAKRYKLPTPPGDAVNAAPRNEGIASALLEAGQWDMLAEWATGRNLSPGLQIRWAERQVDAGDSAAARSRLATLATLAGTSQRLADVDRVQLMLAQARVGAGTDRPDLDLLAAAHAAAAAIDRPQNRAQALLAVARAYAAAGAPPAKIRQLLAAARAGFDTVLSGNSPRQAPVDFSFAAMQLGLVAQEFVAAGSLDEALTTATQPFLRPGSLAAGHQIQGLDARVDAAIWARNAIGMAPHAAQAAFAALPPGNAKAQALDQVLRAASARPAAAAAWQAAALRELAASDAYLEAAASSQQRRALIGVFAGWLRSVPAPQGQAPVQTASRATQLEQLALQARRISHAGSRARGLCELGLTGISLGLPAGRQLLQEGSTLSTSYEGRFYPLDPAPTGACAYWSRQAGDKDAAAGLVDRTVESLRGAVRRKPDGQHPAYAGEVLNTSLALFEAEQGELLTDWAQGYWRD